MDRLLLNLSCNCMAFVRGFLNNVTQGVVVSLFKTELRKHFGVA